MSRQTATRIATTLALSLPLCLTQRAAHAWGDDGHKIVGLIASQYLDAVVKAQVSALLAGDATHLTADTDIASEATWADKYRDSDRINGPRYRRTHNWHYVDIELSSPDLDAACNHHPAVPAGTPASAADANDCVVDKVEHFAAELANPATAPDERRMALQFLLHFVGDLHQPLHAANDHDKGGNAKKVTGGGASDLHSVWDTPFVTALGHDDAAVASDLMAQITPAQLAQWRQGGPADWARETFQVAQSEAYGKLPPPQANGSYALSSAYVLNARQVVRQQLSRAGVRLAMVLNQALGAGGNPVDTRRELLGNPGFEHGLTQPSPWVATAGVVSNAAGEPPHGGTFDAWLNGYGSPTTDTVKQKVAIPAGAKDVALSFWLHIDTDEATGSKRNDTLTVQVLNTVGKVRQTLATYANVDAATGYVQHSFDLSAYAGQTIVIQFTGRENASRRTSFVLDDVSLMATLASPPVPQ